MALRGRQLIGFLNLMGNNCGVFHGKFTKRTKKTKDCAFLVDGVFGVIVKLRCIISSFGKTGETRRRKADRV